MSLAVPDPWAELARTDLILLREDIGEDGRYYHSKRVIVVRKGLLIVEERAVLWHELVHHWRADVRCGSDWHDAAQERSVDREAARRALPLSALEVALRRHLGSRHDAADALKTTERLLQVRMDHLHPAERHHLRRELERVEWAA